MDAWAGPIWTVITPKDRKTFATFIKYRHMSSFLVRAAAEAELGELRAMLAAVSS